MKIVHDVNQRRITVYRADGDDLTQQDAVDFVLKEMDEEDPENNYTAMGFHRLAYNRAIVVLEPVPGYWRRDANTQ